METIEVIEQLKAKGFPHRNCKATIQFTCENSALCAALGKDSQPLTLDVESIQKRGLVLGLRTQKGHKMLYEWNQIIAIF